MSGLSYGSADVTDISVIFSLCKALIDQYEDIASIDYEKVLGWVRNKIESNISKYICVYCEKDKVAYYCLNSQSDGWELDDLYVVAPYRGRGIGSQILSRCIEQTQGNLYLYVFKENLDAIRLYEKFGFTVKQSVGATRLIMHRCG